ncbi:MAG TPA: DUF371 domain-containing protein [Methanothermococcus okinawensis]|uniref:DUF371 domain-containing protein n=1 Tax=Methanothermococcus okinawensis TaxID=155863 RepID=A0A833DR43_9EURY|nr:DUF371 domain-containing protein [Methanothermococcus okinawensis]
MKNTFVITAKGHPNIKSTHKTTLEITKENYLTPRGDCILGISANRSMRDFPEEFKEKLRNSDKITVEITVDNLKEVIVGKGHKDLILNHPTDIVIRKSDYLCPRTLFINADKGAKDIDRKLVDKLKEGYSLIFKIIID